MLLEERSFTSWLIMYRFDTNAACRMSGMFDV